MRIEPGQVAVVTGAASGIGFAVAESLARRGVLVALADVEAGALQTALEQLTAAGAEAIGVRVDVSQAEDLERLRDETLARFGRIDIVCNNAGVNCAFGPLWDAPLADWRWVVDVNLWGVIHGVRTFAPLLVAQGSGHLVNVASMAGLLVIPFNGVYNATKHAVVSITETLRAEFDQLQTGVGATVVCPGMVTTRIADSARNRPEPGPARAGMSLRPPQVQPGADGPVRLSASDVAEQIVAAIEKNQLYLATNPGSGADVTRRVERVLAETAAPLA